MESLVELVSQVSASLKGDLVMSAALALLLLGPGAVCCWLGYHVTGVRIAAGATTFTKLHGRARRTDRIDERLTSICTALALLTDSTEAGLRETINGLDRLSDGAAAAPARTAPPVLVRSMPSHAQTPRDIAIAEGVSEGEVRLRLRLQGIADPSSPLRGFGEAGFAPSTEQDKETTCQAVSTAH